MGLGYGAKGIAREALDFQNIADGNLDMADYHIYMGTGAIGNDDEILTFASGATGLASFAGGVTLTTGNLTLTAGHMYIGANAIGNDDEILTFAAGATGAATLAGSLYIGGDADTGITLVAADQMGLWAGGIEVARCTEATQYQFIVCPGTVQNNATYPSLAFGDGNTGFLEESDNVLLLSIGGNKRWQFDNLTMGYSTTSGGGIYATDASATAPSLLPAISDINTGVGAATADALSLIAGGVEMMRLVELTGGNFIDVKAPLHYSGHQFDDNFLSTSKNYGNRWDITNTSGAGTNAIKTGAGEGGVVLLTTGATTGNYECTQTESTFFSRALAPMTCVHISLETDLVGKHVKFGFSDNPMVEDGEYCMFLFDYTADGVNWWSHSSDGTDASLATGPTAGVKQDLKLYITAAGVAYFYVNDVLKGTVTGALDADTALYLFFGIATEADNAEIIEVDHVSAAWGY